MLKEKSPTSSHSPLKENVIASMLRINFFISSFRPLSVVLLLTIGTKRKPPFVFSVRPFELPLVEHKGRKRVCAFLPVSLLMKISNVSRNDCLQYCKLLSYPPVADRREAVARVVRLPPPYRFNCLWACSFHFSFHDLRLLSCHCRREFRLVAR